jgi:hypothetical protein
MNTRVPEAVQRQADEVEALDAEIAAQETPPEPPAPEPPAGPPPAPAPAADDWQHKFQTLQGKYNAEVPGLRSQVAQLQQQIDELKAAKPATPTPTEEAPAPAKTLITDEDTETYGDDLIDLMRRVVRETDAGEKARLTGEIADLRKQMAAQATQVETVAGNVADERRATYFTDLLKAVPDYEAIDATDEFKTWLLQADEFSGLIRNEILQTAYHAYDVGRTAKVFNQYTAQATPPPPPPPPPVTPQDELASQVSPGQSRSTSVDTPDDGQKVWTVAEIDTFYKAVGRGDFRGQQAEAQRIEADIDRALLEGRVR